VFLSGLLGVYHDCGFIEGYRLSEVISTLFHRGGSKREVVFQVIIPINFDFSRLSQSISTSHRSDSTLFKVETLAPPVDLNTVI